MNNFDTNLSGFHRALSQNWFEHYWGGEPAVEYTPEMAAQEAARRQRSAENPTGLARIFSFGSKKRQDLNPSYK